jgi:fructose-1,6-bisphosphatase/inositol monophosphatase family enzyme
LEHLFFKTIGDMNDITPFDTEELLALLREVHRRVCDAVLRACESSSFEELCGEAIAAAGDTVYAIDHIAEHELLAAMNELIASREPIVLIVEGVGDGTVTLPHGADNTAARWRIIVDPIDGTRGLMFQKRAAWILTGVAPNRGESTKLSDIEIAIQTEIPLVKQHLCDSYWAIKGQGIQVERRNRLNGDSVPFTPQPSTATTLAHGYGTICSFFASGRDLLGRIADELSSRLLSGHNPGEARIFDDQYASTGGQIVGLICGQDRFVADLRPLLLKPLQERGDVLGHCCHPYDICTKLIAEEAGVEIYRPSGEPLDAPLDTQTDVAWVGYANRDLRATIGPVLQATLRELLK